jgi:segregation and condensation protein B
MNIKSTTEAILFASGDGITPDVLSGVLSITPDEAREQLTALQSDYAARKSGIRILEIDGKFEMSTLPEYADIITAALQKKREAPLTPTGLEVLTIIAYNQPTSRALIENIRGSDPNWTLNSLLDKGLIEEAGRLKTPGRPIAYKTTDTFLRVFGFNSLDDLPTLSENTAQIKLDEIQELEEE